MPVGKKVAVETARVTLKNFLRLLTDDKKIASRAYIVGGTVRDALLGLPSDDLDIVIDGEKPAANFAARASKNLKLPYLAHPRFGTYVFKVSDGLNNCGIDIATARSEVYPRPASLPVVRFGAAIEDDLFRRDFTINAMAVAVADLKRKCVKKSDRDDSGAEYFFEKKHVIDPFGGLKDLSVKQIRILHDKSFMDDPTRIIRAARFAARFGFGIEKNTMALARSKVVKSHAIPRLSPARIGNELTLIASEKHPAQTFALLHDIGVARDFFPEINLSKFESWIKTALLSDGKPQRFRRPSEFIADFALIVDVEPEVFFNKYCISRTLKKEIADYWCKKKR